jgi:hypothetical protein
MVLPSAMIGVFVVYRGVFTEGNSDAGRILLHLLIFASGPITFFLARLRRRKLKSEPGETTPSRLNMAESENPQPASKN